MISPEVIRGYIDLIVLESLLDEPSYGYAISRRVESLTAGEYEIKETTLYSALRRLEKSDFVSSYKAKAETGRIRTYYELTATGREHYANRVAEWVSTGALVRRFIRDEHLASVGTTPKSTQ
ncbi:PadR family transcriptional regulator [Gulosibacter bifidus]|uniref:PadR family transcriptional regulator n=1 Tax=Gulosibacter bifidus TaxID=272239 RepID=A0ABW5RHC8_9MICO|nr:PadR family transcriptional regulator [Gulosibacter bifidus]